MTITPNDARWVGAWWLGFFVSSAILLLAGIPFWFFPRSLLQQEVGCRANPISHDGNQEHNGWFSVFYMKQTDTSKGNNLIFVPNNLCHHRNTYFNPLFQSAGFLSSLKKLLGSPVYTVILCEQVLLFSSLIGFFTFKAKYMEQHFGLLYSRANLLIGE